MIENLSNNFVFTCERCKSPMFQLKPKGIVECLNCSRAYCWLEAAGTWMPVAMNVEVYMEKYQNKKWDNNTKEFRNIDELRKEEQLKSTNKRRGTRKKGKDTK